MSREKPLWGIDVSSHQGYLDWSRVKGEGYSFAFTKASEGTYYRNPTYAHNMKGMAANGIVAGVYHYLTDENASAQLDNFFAVIGKIDKGVMVCVDVEEVPGMPPPTWPRVKEFVAGLRKRLGDDRAVVIYSGRWYWAGGSGVRRLDDPPLSDLGKVIVWDSNYFGSAGYASVLYEGVPESAWTRTCWGGRKADILQFTYQALVAGQKIDANAYPGTVTDLKEIGGFSPGEPDKPDPVKPESETGYKIEVAAQEVGGTWFDKSRVDTRIEKLAKLGVKASAKKTSEKPDPVKPEPVKPEPVKPDAISGPSFGGIVVESGGMRRAAKLYSAFNDYRPNAPAQIHHKGEDIECPTNTPHYLLADMVVQAIWDYDSVGGYHQAIMYYVPELEIYVLHGHIMAGVSKWYKAGDKVKRGDIIARGGTAYDAMGTSPHLHLQCAYDRNAAFLLGTAFNNAAVDPATHFRGKVKEFAGVSAASVMEEFDPLASVWREEIPCGADTLEAIEAQDVTPAFERATSCLDPDGNPLQARVIK